MITLSSDEAARRAARSPGGDAARLTRASRPRASRKAGSPRARVPEPGERAAPAPPARLSSLKTESSGVHAAHLGPIPTLSTVPRYRPSAASPLEREFARPGCAVRRPAAVRGAAQPASASSAAGCSPAARACAAAALFGVTSSSSSSRIHSSACSSDIRCGGTRCTRVLGRRGAHVGELLLLHDVDVDVLLARVLADDHALVDPIARLDEHLAAILHVLDGVAA